jgi:GT2 family glycosyltransferase
MTIAVIIPVFNSRKLLSETLFALRSSSRHPDELFVVDDGSTEDIADVAEQFGARVVTMPKNVGPGACRNHAALLSTSEILVFLDADTCVHTDTLERMERHLKADPDLSAVIGSYDDKPSDPGICSQYRNLAHCYVHHSAHRTALTFWSGCGAIRRASFFAVDGFDERYRKPSVEDIELGYRMSDRGAHILLDPEICVTHTKHWTVWTSIVTDVVNRGIPWMTLLLNRKRVPDDLNIKQRHRVATVLTGAALVCLVAGTRSARWLLASCILALVALCLDAGLLRFIYRKRGLRLMLFSAGMTLVQNLCKLAATAGGLVQFALQMRPSQRARFGERRSQIVEHRRSHEEEPVHAAPSDR